MSGKTVLVVPEGYFVTEEGKVFSEDRVLTRKNRWGAEATFNYKGREIKPFKCKRGYLWVSLGRGYKQSIHRLVAMTYLPNSQGKPQVNHIDGNKENNKVDNLEWCDQSENMVHAASLGNRGGPYGKQKLVACDTLDQAMILEYRKAGSIKAMDGFMGCNYTTIGRYMGKRGLINKHKVNQYD